MSFRKIIFLTLAALLVTSCGGGDTDGGSGTGELTGMWRSESNNTLYTINQSGNDVVLNVCNEESPITFTKNGVLIGLNGVEFFTVNNSSQLAFTSESLEGIILNKISDEATFDSGSITITSSNIPNLETSEDVCAYRESDGSNNAIAAPYLDGYLLITLGVDSEATGEFSIPSDVSLSFSSNQLPGGEIDASSGNVSVTAYSVERLEVTFTFLAGGGNEYTGSIEVDI